MRLHETWVGIGGSKLLAIFSALPSTLVLSPQLRKCDDLVTFELDARDASGVRDVWLAVSEECMRP